MSVHSCPGRVAGSCAILVSGVLAAAVVVSSSPARAGSILREVWEGIGGTSVIDLTGSPNYPNNPTSTNYVTDVFEAKRQAVLEHRSQGPQEWFGMYEIMATQRGYESDVRYAEAYVRARNSSGMGGRANRTPKVLVGH